MATHSSTLAWKIPWMQESGRTPTVHGVSKSRTRLSDFTDTDIYLALGLPGSSDGRESACNLGDQGSILGLRRYPGEENGNPLQYSCLENSKDRGVWWATATGVAKHWTRLSY